MTLTSQTASKVLCTTLFMGILAQGNAHQASSGWTYPPACCNDHKNGGDCAAIPSSDVRKGPRGYSIFIHPGDHPLATRNHQFFVPYGDEIRSGDNNYHICLHPTENYLNCFFAPPDSLSSAIGILNGLPNEICYN